MKNKWWNSRWYDSQRVLWNMKSACFFLSLLSIAEEYNDEKVDLLDAAKHCMDRGWIDIEYFVNNDTKILEWLTGKKVQKKVVNKIGVLADNVYSIEKWEWNGGNHFRRRGFDVYEGSQTVKNGNRVCYYIYTIG